MGRSGTMRGNLKLFPTTTGNNESCSSWATYTVGVVDRFDNLNYGSSNVFHGNA